MARLQKLGLGGSLLLFDRWYPSREFIAYTLEQGFSFVMRVRDKWNLAVDAVAKDGAVTITYDGKKYRIRVIKVPLSTGETETLLTNLTEKQLLADRAGELYFKRWNIETAYDTLKSKLQLENFSGKTEISVKQDFYATIYLMGFAEIRAAEATDEIEATDAGKTLKHARKASMNRTIVKLRDHFWTILLEKDPISRNAMLDTLCAEIAAFPESIRPGRSPKRHIPRNKRFPIAKKCVLP